MYDNVRIGRWCCALAFVLLAQSANSASGIAGNTTIPEKPSPLPPLALSLRGALAAAVDNNPDVQLYKERVAAAEAQVRTQFGALMPNVESNVQQSRQVNFLGKLGLSPTRTDPFSIFDARANGSQNLFSMSLIQKWRASRQSLQATEFEAEGRKYDTMASVALSYMEGLKALGMVKMHESNQQIIGELLGMLKQRQKGGVATGLDVARLEAQMANEKQMAASSRYDFEHAKFNVLNLLNLPYETPIAFTDQFKADASGYESSQTAIDEALAGRPEVQAQFSKVKALELTYSSITGERFPSLVAQGDFGWIGNRAKEAVETYSMALLLRIPIFDGGQREGRIAEARSNLRQEVLRMRSVLNQVKMEVHDALAALAAAKEQVALAQVGLQAATKELDLAKERFAVITTASYFEITNGLTNIAKGKENLVNALFQLNASRTNLARSTGSLHSLD